MIQFIHEIHEYDVPSLEVSNWNFRKLQFTSEFTSGPQIMAEKYLKDFEAQTDYDVGKLIPLADLGEYPKDFQNPLAFKLILTQQRRSFLRLLLCRIGNNHENGCTLIGPHGVGKSTLAYFFAASAFRHEHILVYIPTVSEWCSQHNIDDNHAAKYFLEKFQKFNLNSQNMIVQEFLTQFKRCKSDQHYALQLELMLKLGEQKEIPVWYIFDKHKEIFDKKKEKSRYISSFVKWTGITSGNLTITVYSGSHHSNSISTLPRNSM
jgi:hypothetical protein